MKSQYRTYRVERVAASGKFARRKRAAAIAGGVLAALLASIIGLDSYSNGGRIVSAVAAAAKDPAALFAKRSPGARAGGWLMQTKPGRPAPALSHRERGNPPPITKEDTAITYEPGEVETPSPVPLVYEEALTPPGDFAVFTPITGEPPVNPPPPGEQPPGGGVGDPPPGHPGGGGSITIPPGVPEPSVWAMLIVGFFSVGGVMRAQRRQKAVAVVANA